MATKHVKVFVDIKRRKQKFEWVIEVPKIYNGIETGKEVFKSIGSEEFVNKLPVGTSINWKILKEETGE